MFAAGGAGELFGGGFLNLITCRQRPIGRAGRAQDAQDATFRPAPSGSSPSRHPWLVGLSRGLCRGLRRNKQTPSPPLPLPRGRKAAPSIRSTCRPTLDAVAHSSCQLSTRFRLNPCIFGLNTLPKSFLGTDTPKTRALATPEQVATAPVPSRGGKVRSATVTTPSYHAPRPNG